MKSYDKQNSVAKFAGNFFLKFNDLLEQYVPQYVLIENV